MIKTYVVEYQTASDLQRYFGISTSSLRRWSLQTNNKKFIRCLRYGQTGKRLSFHKTFGFHYQDVRRHLGLASSEKDHKKTEKIVYCRVAKRSLKSSSAHQKEDLQRQIQDLSEYYPDHIVISDIASGLNFKRKGLQTLLDKTVAGLVQEVVVIFIFHAQRQIVSIWNRNLGIHLSKIWD
jgi:predicted site-specific integrase-resolvase